MSAGPGRPRILLVCDWLLRYATGLASGLVECDCEVTMVTRDHGLEFAGDVEQMHEFIAAALRGQGRHLMLPGRVSDPRTLRQAVHLRRSVGNWAPDIVHVQEGISNDPRLGFVARLSRGPYALTVHDPVPHPGEQRSSASAWRSPGQRRLRRRAGLVFVHSEVLAEETRSTGDVRAPIEVVPHGVDVIPPPGPPPRDPPTLLFFGRITYYKGLDILLDAMPEIWEGDPAVRLVIAGSGELPEHPLLGDRRIELRIGHVPDEEVPRLFTEATVVVLPYRQASQSGVGSLAKQYHRALVVTEVGGLPELIDPKMGRLVAPEDPRAIAATVIEILREPGLAESMGEAAGAAAADACWDRVGAETLAAYRRHLGLR